MLVAYISFKARSDLYRLLCPLYNLCECPYVPIVQYDRLLAERISLLGALVSWYDWDTKIFIPETFLYVRSMKWGKWWLILHVQHYIHIKVKVTEEQGKLLLVEVHFTTKEIRYTKDRKKDRKIYVAVEWMCMDASTFCRIYVYSYFGKNHDSKKR